MKTKINVTKELLNAAPEEIEAHVRASMVSETCATPLSREELEDLKRSVKKECLSTDDACYHAPVDCRELSRLFATIEHLEKFGWDRKGDARDLADLRFIPRWKETAGEPSMTDITAVGATNLRVPVMTSGKVRLQLWHRGEYPDQWSVFLEEEIEGPGYWDVDLSTAKRLIRVAEIRESETPQ
jgi:hypothetical protein